MKIIFVSDLLENIFKNHEKPHFRPTLNSKNQHILEEIIIFLVELWKFRVLKWQGKGKKSWENAISYFHSNCLKIRKIYHYGRGTYSKDDKNRTIEKAPPGDKFIY